MRASRSSRRFRRSFEGAAADDFSFLRILDFGDG